MVFNRLGFNFPQLAENVVISTCFYSQSIDRLKAFIFGETPGPRPSPK